MPNPTLTRICTLVVASLLSAACSTAGHSTPTNSAPTPAPTFDDPVRVARDILTGDEIRPTGVGNAFDGIVRLRPEFLGHYWSQLDNADSWTPQGGGSLAYGQQQPTVFVDGIKHGGLTTLRTIPAGDIREIRYYHGTGVPFRYGAGVGAVIDVRTKE